MRQPFTWIWKTGILSTFLAGLFALLPFFTVTMPNAALLFGTLIVGFAIGVLTAGHIVSGAKQSPAD